MGSVEPILLHELLSGCLREVERQIAGRGVRIVRQIDRTAPPLFADRESILQVIETILGEAAAGAAEHGSLRVCLKHNRSALMVSIKNQGAGMEKTETESLFDDRSRPRLPGAPLSLPECREVLMANDGNVFANATPGKGSTFYVTFRAPKAD